MCFANQCGDDVQDLDELGWMLRKAVDLAVDMNKMTKHRQTEFSMSGG